MIIKDRDDFYRDSFINDPASHWSMFPEPSALCGWWSRHDEREILTILQDRPDHGIEETIYHKEV